MTADEYPDLYNVFLNLFQPGKRGWEEELTKQFPKVRIRGADIDHGTIVCPPELLDEVRAFLGVKNYRLEKNTDGDILCDAIDMSL